mmetsp:Transcript_4284/g.4364  ORF Transcript_4284/g.4364 Transcript_4284/m.4364 type:complete len:89 (+) Transcript_4284:238-504(+)
MNPLQWRLWIVPPPPKRGQEERVPPVVGGPFGSGIPYHLYLSFWQSRLATSSSSSNNNSVRSWVLPPLIAKEEFSLLLAVPALHQLKQ